MTYTNILRAPQSNLLAEDADNPNSRVVRPGGGAVVKVTTEVVFGAPEALSETVSGQPTRQLQNNTMRQRNRR